MEITYLGHSSFRIKGRTATIITDPYDPKKVGLKFPRVDADIVTVSHEHGDHNHLEVVKNVKMVIKNPGEYESMGVSFIGIPTFHDEKKGELRGKNTIFIIEIDDIRVAHLGDLGHPLSEKTMDQMGDIDIVLIPVGGEYTINATQAAQITRNIEPNIAIPMHFYAPGLEKKTFGKLTDEKTYLTDIGYPVERLSKLSVKKTLLEEEHKTVVLEKR